MDGEMARRRRAALRRLRGGPARQGLMKAGTRLCPEYQELLKELITAAQLCAEYESPTVLPIDGWQFTPEQTDQIRNAALEEKKRAEARVFIHQCTCLSCMRSP